MSTLKEGDLADKFESSSIPPEFSELKNMNFSEAFTFLIYGGAGTGKTELIGSAGSRTLIINNGSGLLTLKSPGFKQRHPNVNPIIVTVGEELDSHGQPQTAKAFDKVCDLIDYALKNFPERFDTIAIDDMTAQRRFAMNKGLEVGARTGISKSLEKRDKYDVTMPAVQDYGLEMSLMSQFISGYVEICKSAGKHLIMASHEKILYQKPKDSQGKTILGEPPVVYKIRPAFTGSAFPDDVPALFDFVWYTEVVGSYSNVAFRVRTVGSEDLIAKSRGSGIFKATETNPNFLDVVKKLQAYLK